MMQVWAGEEYQPPRVLPRRLRVVIAFVAEPLFDTCRVEPLPKVETAPSVPSAVRLYTGVAPVCNPHWSYWHLLSPFPVEKNFLFRRVCHS